MTACFPPPRAVTRRTMDFDQSSDQPTVAVPVLSNTTLGSWPVPPPMPSSRPSLLVGEMNRPRIASGTVPFDCLPCHTTSAWPVGDIPTLTRLVWLYFGVSVRSGPSLPVGEILRAWMVSVLLIQAAMP